MEKGTRLKVKRLSDEAMLPEYGSAGAGGLDVFSPIATKIPARGQITIPLGIAIQMECDDDIVIRVGSRSGLAHKNGLDVGAGWVDQDFTSTVGVVMFNHTDKDFDVAVGDKLAQLFIIRIHRPKVVEVSELSTTARGSGGFGSTGMKSIDSASQ
jgi:dUTP pyrophosphatase